MLLRKFICTVFLFLGALALQAQVGDTFPYLEGTTLSNVDLKLPADTKGKFTLIGMAYSKKSEDDLQSWFSPVYNTFIHKSSSSLFGDVGYDVNVYFVPMFTGVKKAAANTAERKMKEKVDPKLLPHILFYRGDLKTYKDALDFEKKDVPYFFVLDKEGVIIYATSGSYSPSKIKKVEELVEEW
jgi:hypothetical protein